MNIGNGKENTLLLLVIFGAFIVFLIFFSSKQWLYDDEPIRHTPYGETVSKLSGTELVINDWEFNKNKNFMEVQVSKTMNTQNYTDSKLEVQAYDFESKDAIKTEKAYETDEVLLIRLSDVDKDIRFIDLKFEEDAKDNDVEVSGNTLDSDSIENDSNDTIEDKEDEEEKSSVILFGDYREINVNNDLEKRNQKGYQLLFVQNDIDEVNHEIKEIRGKEIPELEERIVNLENDIKSMEGELEYTTGEEKNDLKSDIKGNENKIESTIEEKKELKSDIEELRNKREKYNEKANDLKET